MIPGYFSNMSAKILREPVHIFVINFLKNLTYILLNNIYRSIFHTSF